MTPPPADPQATLFDAAGMASGLPERLLAATPTRLSGWLSCRRRYRFTYLDRPAPRRGAPWARTSVGAAVHTALARWWQTPAPLRTPGRAGALVAVAWIAEGFRDAAQSAAARGRAADMVSRYVGTLDPQAPPRAVERTVGTRTAVLALSGRIDRLDERLVGRPLEQVERGEQATEELVVVDYKTGRHAPTVSDVRSSLALAVYAVAAARTFRRVCRRVELHHLPSGRVVAHDHDTRSLATHLRRADAIGLELREVTRRWDEGLPRSAVESLFPPAPGPGCAWCDFRVSCPEGARASRALPPWAGLDEVEHRPGTEDAADLGNPADGEDLADPDEVPGG